MKIYVKETRHAYPAEQLALMLMPEAEPRAVVGNPPGEGDFAQIDVKRTAKSFIAAARLSYRGKSAAARSIVRIPEKTGEREEKMFSDRALKRAFYMVYTSVTGKLPAWGALSGVRPAKVAEKFIKSGRSDMEAEKELMSVNFLSSGKARLCVAAARASQKVGNMLGNDDISLYIGIPFCPTRCSYCSFISRAVKKDAALLEEYISCLLNETEAAAKTVNAAKKRIKTLYIGGGTPTVLTCVQLKRLLSCISERFSLENLAEYTVEAGRPDTINAEKLGVLSEFGVTRISINPQSFNDETLKSIGRMHTASETVTVFALAREAGSFQINMDLIAGLPKDNENSFRKSVEAAISLGPENITVHSFAQKRGADYIKSRTAAEEEIIGRMIEKSQIMLSRAGYKPYYIYRQKYASGLENTGWCKPGGECLYNIIMMQETGTILSLGAGGMTKIIKNSVISRISNPKYPDVYIKEIDNIICKKRELYDILRG